MKLPEEIQFIANSRMPQKTTDARLDGQVCVITGATSGVGYQIAKRLAEAGAHLILVNRNDKKARRVRDEITNQHNIQVDLVQADFSNLDDVRDAATKILSQYSAINVLINNAGLHLTRRTLTAAGYETVFCVNHLASFLFTRLLLERMIETAPSRIIQVSSEGHRFGGLDLDDLHWEKRRYNGYKSYGASKTAQLLTVWEIADRLNGSGVTINAVHPGAVATNIGMNNGKLFQWYQKIFIFPFLKRPKISGEILYYFAAAPEMSKTSGKFFNQTIEEKPAPHALDRKTGHRILELSEQLTGLKPLELNHRQ
ncbi:MAG TPA: short-chain dehydrogenase [Anaerolineae bacterium]|nr:short-chain dehydrogenase [Anaerolineae bacterium]